MEVSKEYTNGEVTVVWKPKACYHAAKCVGGLPEVFKPKEKPWINLENAETDDIIATVKLCPSGALTIKVSDEEKSDTVEVSVLEDGPLLVSGVLEVNSKDGIESKKGKTAFCRCGASQKKPYCDGAHTKIKFKG